MRRIGYVITFTGSAMWFLPTMFVSSIVFLMILTIKNGKALVIYVSAIIAFMVGLFFPNYSELGECFLKAAVGVGFICSGYIAANFLVKKSSNKFLYAAILLHLMLLLSNKTVSLDTRDFGNPVIYIFESIVGTFVIVQLAEKIPQELFMTKFLTNIGENSILYLCLHGVLIQIIRLVDYKCFNIFPRLDCLEGILLTAIIILVIYLSTPMVKKCFWWSFGFKKDKQVTT